MISIGLAILVLFASQKKKCYIPQILDFVKIFVPNAFDPLKLALIFLLQWLKPVNVVLNFDSIVQKTLSRCGSGTCLGPGHAKKNKAWSLFSGLATHFNFIP